MAKLKFKEDEDGQPTKEAVGMYSKDGEYVDFDEPCKCVGQVRIGNMIMYTNVYECLFKLLI